MDRPKKTSKALKEEEAQDEEAQDEEAQDREEE